MLCSAIELYSTFFHHNYLQTIFYFIFQAKSESCRSYRNISSLHCTKILVRITFVKEIEDTHWWDCFGKKTMIPIYIYI